MAKACGTTEYSQNKMLEMLFDYNKKELCHLLYVGEAAFIPENKEIDISRPVILIRCYFVVELKTVEFELEFAG